MEKQMPEVFQEAKYDVFISYSHLDYLDENDKPREDSPVKKLMDFLRGKDIHYWIDNDGEYGRNHLPKSINTAICESKMMVFVSSYNSNIISTWTPGEISRAFEHKIPVLPFKIDDTLYGVNIDTRVSSSLHYDYYVNPARALESLYQAILKEKDHYRTELLKKREELKSKKLDEEKKRVRVDIANKGLEYSQKTNELKTIFNQIVQMHIDIGELKKKCPVCKKFMPVEYTFCKNCGWTFYPPFNTSGDNKKSHSDDMEQLVLMQGVWEKVLSSGGTADGQRQISEMKKELDEYTAEISKLKSDNSTLKAEVTSYRGKISKHGKQEKALKDKISELEEKLKQAMISPNNSGHGYVDLGLPSGTLWATCNVGASKPSDYGDYFAWGETGSKKDYGWSNLEYCNDSTGDRFSKYNRNQAGRKDKKSVLELMDDAAHANWGGSWRMPTVDEWEELKNNCTWIWTSQDGHNGYKVTGKNGGSIFLPAAGWRNGGSQRDAGVNGDYWSSSLRADESYRAFGCYFYSGGVLPSHWGNRFLGLSVRPVVSSLW